MDMCSKLMSRIIKASKGQRDAMYFASRRMNLVNDLLAIPTVLTSAVLGSTLLSQQANHVVWIKYFCASIAFLNALLMTIQKICRPGEYGEMYQAYGRKWELFALNILSMRKWKTGDAESADTKDIQDASLSAQLVEKYNNMIDQSPLLPRWALSRFKECNENLSSDDEEDMHEIELASSPRTSLKKDLDFKRPVSRKRISIDSHESRQHQKTGIVIETPGKDLFLSSSPPSSPKISSHKLEGVTPIMEVLSADDESSSLSKTNILFDKSFSKV